VNWQGIFTRSEPCRRAGRDRSPGFKPDGSAPAATRCAPTAAIIAPLSVHKPGFGTRRWIPADASARRPVTTAVNGRDAAGDHQGGRPEFLGRLIAFAVSTSRRLLERAATSASGTGRPSLSRCSPQRATAVLRPEKESLLRVARAGQSRGNAIAQPLPCLASLSIAGHPGRAGARTLATLSYRLTGQRRRWSRRSGDLAGESSTSSSDECPPDTSSARHGEGKRTVFEGVGGEQ